MKTTMTIAWFIVASAVHAEERIAVKASSGRFEVAQDFQGGRDQGDGEFLEIVRFRNTGFSQVRLSGLAWPGIYNISPDEHWLLRTQKTGSGESIAMLYRVEENGRVSEVQGFDGLLWSISDAASRLKRKDLYHTRVADFAWSEGSSSLEIVLRGSNASKSGDGIDCRIQYELRNHRVVSQQASSDQVGAGQPTTRSESNSEGGDKPQPELDGRSRGRPLPLPDRVAGGEE
ncbi:hypothetical protein [Haloferula sargassicola]